MQCSTAVLHTANTEPVLLCFTLLLCYCTAHSHTQAHVPVLAITVGAACLSMHNAQLIQHCYTSCELLLLLHFLSQKHLSALHSKHTTSVTLQYFTTNAALHKEQLYG
eukprot:17391-Heterococcus_DN1.PRE.1